MKQINEKFHEIWEKAFGSLNAQQKEAVECIEGPVMTIAGPGTGKTQLLAVRIGKILMDTDASANNILCLTYTEAGAVEMRNRLVSFIGPEAYNVNIYTFHAFCNAVIKENIKYFGNYRDLQLISEIEEVDIYRSLIDRFPDDHPLKRYKGDIYYETHKLKSLFSTMKQEGWTVEEIEENIEKHRVNIMDPAYPDSKYIYKRRHFDKKSNTQFEKGDLNPGAVKTEMKRYENLLLAARELENYNGELRHRERFDYQDMILWVIQKFREYDELLGIYQERFQYILVDEYQDTNGAQNDLLFLLADYWERPNLFIVGDDDQSIYRFQGANMNSIIDFKNKFSPKEIVLTANYRSSQVILDSARKLIEYNEDRLTRKYPYLTKNLYEARREIPAHCPDPHYLVFGSEREEEAWLANKIKDLYANGTAYNEIAVIYSKHKIAENLIKYFSVNKIPLNVKKRVNVLKEKDIVKLITLLTYLHNEFSRPYSGEDLLFEILHFDYFDISPLDIALVSMYCGFREYHDAPKKKWRNVINAENELLSAGVRHPESFLTAANLLEQWISYIPNVTIQSLIEKILTESNVLFNVLNAPDKSWKLQIINTFYDLIKNEAAKKGELSLAELINLLEIMEENSLELPAYQIISSEDGVNFLSAHGSKGLQFKHVFVFRAASSLWEKKTGNNNMYPLPPTLSSSIHGGEIEDDRRLMYVAVTRAEDHVYITCPKTDNNQKNMEPSRFVSEIFANHEEVQKTEVPEYQTLEFTGSVMQEVKGNAILIDHDVIRRQLEHFRMSTTNLNKYLKCKLSFYFENILRVPMGRSASMGFGSAIHYAFEMLFYDIEDSRPRSIPPASKLIMFFENGMEKYRSHFTAREFSDNLKHGTKVLEAYFNNYSSEWLSCPKYHAELGIKNAEFRGIPISGQLDRINYISGNTVSVTDYKTGKYDASKLKGTSGEPEDPGGDYWRQIVFYKILLDSYKDQNLTMEKGIMDFVEPDKEGEYKRREFTVEPFEVEHVAGQIASAYSGIMNHDFFPGCEKEECLWCNFVKNSDKPYLSYDEETIPDMQDPDIAVFGE
jgi:DNA helicase-2/ATP-dependent DNA helicase PcrA